MPSKNARHRLAEFLSQDLSNFGGCFSERFLCPACMVSMHPEQDVEKYTAGHIVPESAGGTEWTILCRSCNSQFGTRQDKWFGEYLSVLKNPKGTFFHAKSKSRYITVNGVTVSGSIDAPEEDGSIRILTFIDRNPPGKLESIPLGPEVTVQFTPEVIKHVNEIHVGHITAAYLTWFKALGYSWVMQSSLESVRKQILECNYALDGAKVIEIDSENFFEPTIGVIAESGYVYPCCLMFDRVVVFPAPDLSNAPSPKAILFSTTHQITLLNLEVMNVPYSVNFEGNMLVLPDMLRKELTIPENMLYVPQDPESGVQWLVLEK